MAWGRAKMVAMGDDVRRSPVRTRGAALASRPSARVPAALAAVLILAATLALPSALAPTAGAAPVGPLAIDALHAADLTRPRIVLRPSDIPVVQARLDREPYVSLLRAAHDRAEAAPPPNPADQATCVQTANKDREALKDRAAFDLSFFYVIDRVYDPGTNTVVQPSTAERLAIGDRVRDYLRFMCTESRTKIQADRDISTSHELLLSAAAYDNLAGGGYDFGGVEPSIIDNLVALTAEFYANYNDPNSANIWIAGASRFAVNNHRSKGAASIAVAAMVLAEYTAPPGSDPDHRKEPARWLDFGLDRVDLVQRYTYGAGDGAYGEGMGYWHFSSENVVPFARAWDRLVGGATVHTAAGVEIPSLWRHPQFALMQRWALDHTLPDGTLAPIEDTKTGERGAFGMFPADFPDAAAFGWRWANATVPYESENNIDLAPFEIVAYDDGVVPTPPAGSTNRFYLDGGDAIFRSDLAADGVLAIVLGQHGAGREFGRERDGTGELWSAAHDQPDPGSFLLHAYGERLLLDPGYMDFPWSQQQVINKPSDHNMILLDAIGADGATASPIDPFAASAVGAPAQQWAKVAGAPVPADGEAQLSGALDSPGLAGVSVTARYGAPAASAALVDRRFLFVDDAYLVTADHVASPVARTYTWPVHGNAGGHDGVTAPLPAKTIPQHPPQGAPAIGATPYVAAGGSFTPLPSGGQWDRGTARVTVGLAFDADAGPPTALVRDTFHERARNSLGQHTALFTSVSGTDVDALTISYPTPTTHAPPTLEQVDVGGSAALRLTDVDGDRRIFLVRRAKGAAAALRTFDAVITGSRPLTTDASLVVLDTHLDGSLRSLSLSDATVMTYDGVTHLQAARPSTLALHLDGDRADVIADTGSASVTVTGLPFVAASAAGACAGPVDGSVGNLNTATVSLGTERRFTLFGTAGDRDPAADPSADEQRVAVGADVTLDASASCDAGGGALAATWQLVSAPPASHWLLSSATSMQAHLIPDAPGPYRVRLTVTDPAGTHSATRDVLVFAGPVDADGLDTDLDGRFDIVDPDHDLGPPAPPPTTTTTTTAAPPTTIEPSSIPTTIQPLGPSTLPATVASGRVSGVGATTPTSGSLPSTGSDPRALVLAGALLVLAGAATLVARRRGLRP
jgi:LPXTG-motif cell wall-anchored protein